MKFVIGEKIKEKVLEKGVTLKSFAAAIGMTTRNLDRFFERSDVSIKQLVRASEFLNYDFVELYMNNIAEGASSAWKTDGDRVSVLDELEPITTCTINIRGGFEALTKELPGVLKSIKKEVESKGLHLG